MIAGLEWVQKNIPQFNGDTNNITLMGESAGAANIDLLMAAPQAQSLFQRAIMISGFFYRSTVDEAMHGSSNVLNHSGRLLNNYTSYKVPSLKHLRQLSPQDILNATIPFSAAAFSAEFEIGDVLQYGIEDNVTVMKESRIKMLNNKREKPAIIIGGNRDEMRSFLATDPRTVSYYLGLFPSFDDPFFYEKAVKYASRLWLIKGVYEPAKTYASLGYDVYVYRFDWDDVGNFLWVDLKDFACAAHSIGLAFVFNDFLIAPMAQYLYPGNNRDTQSILAHQIGQYFGNFSKGEKILKTDNVVWSKFTTEKSAVLLMDIAEDGGLRMVNTVDHYASWLADLKNDAEITQQQRCLIVDLLGGIARDQEMNIRETLGCY